MIVRLVFEGIPPFKLAKRQFEREYVDHLMRNTRGNVAQAAKMAKKDRKDFYDLLKRNQIKPSRYRLNGE